MTQMTELVEAFEKQASFTESYSPLYSRIFSGIVSCFEKGYENEITKWILNVSSERTPFETTLLLVAGMHREVLLDAPGTQTLRLYYPSVGGCKSHNDAEFVTIFMEALGHRKDALTDFMKHATVQTNEAARGIFWLLPALVTGWKSMHLVELGASAGLNLVADHRRFTMVATDNESDVVSLGRAKNGGSNQHSFVSKCDPTVPHFWKGEDAPDMPIILSRSGCDLHPLPLETVMDRTTLKSFVWADQVERMTLLEEGMDALDAFCAHQHRIPIVPAQLPQDLPTFLQWLPLHDDDAPVLIYNSVVTLYLDDDAREQVRNHMDDWAKESKRTVLWIQAEPPEQGMPAAPEGFKWYAWTAHLWKPNGAPLHWHLAWVHPHGKEIKWQMSQLEAFVEEFRGNQK